MIIKNGKRLDGFCVDSLPIGTLQPFLGLKAPNGYLICDGSLISKTVYPDLYAICGSLFGAETDTHFYLPDLRGKTIAGYNADDSTLNTIGKLLGSTSHEHLSPLTWIQKDSTYYVGVTNSQGTERVTGDRDFYGSVTNEFKDSASDLEADGWEVIAYNTSIESNYQPTMVANWIVKAKMIVPITAVVENNLNSASEINALSAAQGKILDNKKINKELPVYVNDLDDINETGFIYADSASTNKPTATNGYVMTMRLDDNYLKQVFYNNSSEANVYERVKYAGTWEPWKQTGPIGALIKTQSVATPSINGVAGTEYEGYLDINIPAGYSVLSVCHMNTSNSDKNFVSYNLYIYGDIARIYYMINCRYSNTDLDTRFLIYYIKTSQ